MKNPLFSILMANYNNGQYLLEAVESVKAQTYSNWELIIVDDKSSDCSKDIYDTFVADSRIRVTYNNANMGCAWTKHHCATLANGKYCGYLDPDDVLLPQAVELTVKNLEAHPWCVLSLSRYYFCDNNLEIMKESRLLELQYGETYLEHHDYMPEVFAGWSRDAYFKSGGLNVFLKAAVDQDLYFRLEEQGDICILDAFTYKYRIHSGSVSRNDRTSAFWNLMVRYDACVRRGMDMKLLAYADFVNYCENEKRSGESIVRESKSYRIGKFLLSPFKLLKNKR